ncbi:MAG: hypothetical protein IBX61_05380 [Thermoleophilia bacterium]|nr:hypothetical protein [Thermoleophilia bacterium]
MWIFPLIATVISALFAAVLMRQYFARRNPANLVWSVALVIFAVGSACDLAGSISGWTPFIARLYYLSGAVIVVGYLAAGTLYLLAPRTIAHIWLVLMLAVTVTGTILLATASVDQAMIDAGDEPGWRAIDKPPLLTVLSISVNSLGTAILVGGAVYSAVYRRFPLANILIAAGALIIAGAGTLTRLGQYEFQSIGQAIGIIVIFAGFLMVSRAGRRPAGRS